MIGSLLENWTWTGKVLNQSRRGLHGSRDTNIMLQFVRSEIGPPTQQLPCRPLLVRGGVITMSFFTIKFFSHMCPHLRYFLESLLFACQSAAELNAQLKLRFSPGTCLFMCAAAGSVSITNLTYLRRERGQPGKTVPCSTHSARSYGFPLLAWHSCPSVLSTYPLWLLRQQNYRIPREEAQKIPGKHSPITAGRTMAF